MVQSFDLSPSGDVYIGANGNLAVATGLQAIQDACLNVCRARLGEEVLTTGNGLPYFECVFNGSPNLAIFRSYLITVLNNVPGVTSVSDVAISIANNTLSFSATIQTIYGPATVSNSASP
jgi:hypothetical protein